MGHKMQIILYVILISLVSVSLYAPVVSNDYVGIDDTTLVVDNYDFLKNFSHIPQTFRQGVFQVPGRKDTLASYYRPLVTLSLMIDAHLASPVNRYIPPKQFFISNILYHTIACILLFFTLLLLTFNFQLSTPSPPLPSFLLTLIFTVHPLLNQAVAWIPGRNDTLLAIFIFASFISFLKFLLSKKTGWLILHFFFFTIALFTKENAITLIPLIIIFLVLFKKKYKVINSYIKITPVFAILLFGWYFIRQNALVQNKGNTSIEIFHNLLSNIPFYLQYAGKSIFPVGLSVMSTAADTNYLLCSFAILIFAALLLLSKDKNMNIIVFGISWFILFITPSFFTQFTGMEHRDYLPLAGIIFASTEILNIKKINLTRPYPKGTFGQDSKILNHKYTFSGLIVIFLVFYAMSRNRLPVFKNRFTFNENAIKTSPHAVLPCLYIAKDYEQDGEYQKAIDAYKEALHRDSTQYMIHSNIAGEYICLNDYKDAKEELNIELEKHPGNYIAVFNLGLVIYQSEHNDSEAVFLWKKSVTMDSAFSNPYKVLAQYYYAQGDSEEGELYQGLYKRFSHL
jgi:tetratricopeptide (TPR) repeat protein